MKRMFSDVAPFRQDPLGFLIERGTAAREPLAPLAFGLRPIFLLADPEYLKPLMKFSEDLVDKGAMVKKVRAISGNNIIVLSGDEHKRRRAAHHSVVARTAIQGLAPVLAAEARRTIAETAGADTLDARELGTALALRLISVVAFGSNALSGSDQKIVAESLRQAMSDLADLIFRGVPPLPWKYLAQRRRIARSRQNMRLVIDNLRKRVAGSDTIRALDQLQLSESDTTDELLTFLLAGHDTTGSAATWLFHAMATQPGLADRIAAEAAAVRDENGEIDETKLASATTTATAVQEILRLYPSGYWFARGVRQKIEFAGRTLRPGTVVMISPWMFHRSTRFWDDPWEFRLDRNYNSKAYIPFGTGPRVCVGASLAALELQVMALEVASAFRLHCPGKVGSPTPSVHLVPPSIPLTVDRREATTATPMPPADRRTAESAAKADTGICPFHTAH